MPKGYAGREAVDACRKCAGRDVGVGRSGHGYRDAYTAYIKRRLSIMI